MKKLSQDNKGQTTVEYIFLLAAVIIIIMSFMRGLRERFIGDLSSCDRTPLAPVCLFQNAFSSQSNFRYFRLRR